ncbi:zinc finger BED domain-containing protein 1-like [Rhizophagus irregularis DAOM 181602=DAOM 197198]|nr:zinc finger BED domain-containing protein 1-like [Rhizophagus irregularis DAOM 181602=DAOM 197198]
MADDSSYILPSSDDDFSEEITNEMVQIPELPVATKIEQINVISIPDSTVQISAKLQTKVSSWVWKYFIKDYNNKGEIRAYCQFVMENGDKCTKNYKYDGSTGNFSSHIIKHGIIPPTAAENLPAAEIKSKPIQSIDNIGQKEKEESTLRWILLTTQPLSTVIHKAYIEHMHIIDPEFIVPGERKIRMMIAQSLTATWINQNFEITDILLEISYFPAPHTADKIAQTIKMIIQKWEIENLIVSITTDNGANVVAAIRELAPIERFSCTTHTLQLAIGKGLKLVEDLAIRARQLINFFSTQKQIERLVKIQKDNGYEEQLHLIQDIPTRWNSTYLAWDRLIFLQCAILQLNVNLSCSLIREEKADSIKLKKIMLSDNEWELLDELCNILSPFEKATRDLSGNTYVTLSQVVPIITRLTNSLNPSGNLYEEEPDDSFNDLEEENSTNQQTNYDNIRETLENVKKNIYRSLRYYWKIPNEFGIMAALLDPRYKNLDFISDDSIKRKFHSTLRTRYDQLKWDISQQSIPSSPTTVTSAESLIAGSSTPSRSLRDHKARREQKAKEVFQRTEIPTSLMEDEITSYLLMPIARENKNPLDWWRVKHEIFPILSLIAQKYLGIPATSVASERLFSDAGNHITSKRNSLDPGLLGKMIFLKRNMQTMDHINVFPSDLDVEKSNSEEYLSECEFEEW